MAYCIKCGQQNTDKAKFCTGCGVTLKNENTNSHQATVKPEPVTTAMISSKRNTKPLIAGIIIFLCAAIGVYFIFFNKKNIIADSKTSTVTDTVDNPLTEAKILNFLDKWLNAQNNKNLATYSKFYSRNFKGTKRIKSGQTYSYGYDEWIIDRTKMYNAAQNLTMTVSDISVSELTDNTATINFTHGYSSNAYKDIGEKQLHIQKTENGDIQIVKEEMLASYDPGSDSEKLKTSYINSDGCLVYKSDCFIIVTGSFSYEEDVKNEVLRMKSEGYANAGYLWIPDYPSLSGKQFYAPFIGPFQSYSECENNVRSLEKTGRFWYGIKVSYDNTRVEIR